MQTLRDVIASIRKVLRGHPEVAMMEIYGSVARGEMTPESDVDLIVEYDHEVVRQGKTRIRALETELEKALGRSVSIAEKGSLERSKGLFLSVIQPDRKIIFRKGEVVTMQTLCDIIDSRWPGLLQQAVTRRADCRCPGWWPIIFRALDQLAERGAKVHQVKEKFRALTIYTTPHLPEITEAARKESLKTCCVCGRPGELSFKRPWRLTVCEEHDRLEFQEILAVIAEETERRLAE